MSHIGIVAMSQPALGGTFQYTLSMIDALRKIKKNRYTIFTSDANRAYDALGLPIIRVPSAGRTIIEIARAKLHPRSRGRLFSEVDMVIAPIYTTRLLASQRSFLFTLHDMQEKYYPANFTLAQRLWRGFVNNSLSRAAAGIICESACVKNDIVRFTGASESKIHVIAAPPVSDFSLEHIASAEFKRVAEQTVLPDQYIFYPAQFFPHKNHIRLLEAFMLVLKKFPECRLLLTGQKKLEFEKVMARLAELKIQDRVVHLGYVDTAMLAAVYKRATLVVIPTLFESISIPVYEAFRMEVAVCASRVVGLPEQIGNAGLLFDPLSVADIAQKIITLLADQELRKELANRGKERIRALTVDWYAVQLEALLNRVEPK